jgi:hypothetical protein
MNSALIIGVILIIAGIALTVLAYIVSRSDAQDEEEEDFEESLQTSEDAVPEPQVTTSEDDEELIEQELDEPEEVEESPSVEPAMMDAPLEESEPELDSEDTSADQDSVPAITPVGADRIQVATLLRDEVSGELIVRVGDREYSSAEELRASPDWTRIEYATSDLTEWVQTPEVKATVEDQEGEAEQESQTAERKPSTMIEQINTILQEMIEKSGRSELAVRLIEGPGGMARVLIGVHSYEIAEVPDPKVRELIKKAVANWESTQ